MPQKRKARKAADRPKPKLPDGDEGHDLDAMRKQEKLDLIIKDFESKALTFIEDMEGYKKELLRSLEATHRREMLALKPIMKMPIKDFMSQGGALDENEIQQTWEASQMSDKAMEAELNEKFKLDKLCRTLPLDTISEESGNSENQPPRTRTNRQKGMPAPTGTVRASTRKGSMKPPRTGTASTNSKFLTPYHGALNQASRLDTPMQTPSFDPRLPVTPWLKVADPLAAPDENDVHLMVDGNIISEATLESDLNKIPPAALEKLRGLYKHMSNIFITNNMK